MLKALQVFTHFILTIILSGKNYYYTHFTNENTKIQRFRSNLPKIIITGKGTFQTQTALFQNLAFKQPTSKK